MPQQPKPPSRKWIWTGAAIIVVLALYTLGGFYVVPGVIRSQATDWVKTNLNKPIALGDIRFNPFTFTTDIDNLAIPDNAQPMVAVGHLRVSFSPLSLLQSAYRFGEIRLDKPFVHAVVQPGGSLNLIDLVPKKKSEEPSPAVRIGEFSVNQGKIVYADRSRTAGPEETLEPITFTLKDFHTNSAEGGTFTLDAKSELGARFTWTGTVSIAPIQSQGRLTVTGFHAKTIQEFAGGKLPVTLDNGTIGFTTDYKFAYGKDGARMNASVPSITLAGLAVDGADRLFRGAFSLDRFDGSIGAIEFAGANSIQKLAVKAAKAGVHGLSIIAPGGADADAIKFADAELTGGRLDYAAHELGLDSLTINGATLPVRRERNGKISLMALLPETKKAADASAQPAAQAAPWQMHLGTLALNNATLRLVDRSVSPAAEITVTPIDASITSIGTDPDDQANLRFSMKINDAASLEGQGTFMPSSKIADMTVKLSDLSLREFVGYLPRYPALSLRSGWVNASGAIHFDGNNARALRFKGDASVDNFMLVMRATNRPLFKWRAFNLSGIDYRPNSIEIGRGRLVRPFGRIAVLPNRTFNYEALMSKSVPAKTASKPASGSGPKFKLRRLDITGGTMSFADYSLEPNFEARIDSLGGRISNISNAAADVAKVDLSGHVIDRFSPVTIKGEMNPLNYGRQTDMRLDFRNIELPIFNPYSGRYAGYAIAKGKLTTELSYKIDNRALNADQHIVIDQLEWGAATESKEAVPLPIRLATALLKDKDGVIDLDVPLTGSLDDPKFRLGPIIWKIIGNIIEKAVTAPFRLIGALFEGAEKAQFVDFAPGSAELPQGAAQALGALGKALVERPVLKLDIPAGPAIREDADAMADKQIDALLMSREIKRGEPADFAALDLDDRHDRLEDLYRDTFGKRPEFPEFSPDAIKAVQSGKPDLDDDDREEILEAQWMRANLREKFAPTTAQLTALGTARATAVRDALLTGTAIDPARVFMATDMTAKPEEGHSRLELKFE